MKRLAYDYLQQGETSWWYQGRYFAIARALKSLTAVPKGATLDFGAGFGASHDFLLSYSTSVDGFEVDGEGVMACKERGYQHVFSDQDLLPKNYALIGAFDVLEHIKDDQTTANTLYASLLPGGVLAVTVPAFQSLWSAHDELHLHFRRYTKAQMVSVLEKAGFKITYASYWNATLFPVAYVLRKMGKGGGENLTPHKVINGILTALVWLESRFIPLISLPWGTGIVVVAQKP